MGRMGRRTACVIKPSTMSVMMMAALQIAAMAPLLSAVPLLGPLEMRMAREQASTRPLAPEQAGEPEWDVAEAVGKSLSLMSGGDAKAEAFGGMLKQSLTEGTEMGLSTILSHVAAGVQGGGEDSDAEPRGDEEDDPEDSQEGAPPSPQLASPELDASYEGPVESYDPNYWYSEDPTDEDVEHHMHVKAPNAVGPRRMVTAEGSVASTGDEVRRVGRSGADGEFSTVPAAEQAGVSVQRGSTTTRDEIHSQMLFDSERHLIGDAAAAGIQRSDSALGSWAGRHGGDVDPTRKTYGGTIGSMGNVLEKAADDAGTPEQFGGESETLKSLGMEGVGKEDVVVGGYIPVADKAIDTRTLNQPDEEMASLDEHEIDIPREAGTTLLPTSQKIYREAFELPDGMDPKDLKRIEAGEPRFLREVEKHKHRPSDDNLDLQNLLAEETARFQSATGAKTDSGSPRNDKDWGASHSPSEHAAEQVDAMQANVEVDRSRAPRPGVKADYQRGFLEGQRVGLKSYKTGLKTGFQDGYNDGFNFAFDAYARGYKKGYVNSEGESYKVGMQDAIDAASAAASTSGVGTTGRTGDSATTAGLGESDSTANLPDIDEAEEVMDAQSEAIREQQGTPEEMDEKAADMLSGKPQPADDYVEEKNLFDGVSSEDTVGNFG